MCMGSDSETIEFWKVFSTYHCLLIDNFITPYIETLSENKQQMIQATAEIVSYKSQLAEKAMKRNVRMVEESKE